MDVRMDAQLVFTFVYFVLDNCQFLLLSTVTILYLGHSNLLRGNTQFN